MVLQKVRCPFASDRVAQAVGLVITQRDCYDLHASIVALVVYMCVKDGDKIVSVQTVPQWVLLMS